MSNYCNKCKIIVPKHKIKNNNCTCGNKLKYIGSCGECLDFLEFYGGIGICSEKDRVKSTDTGCEKFK